MGGLLEETSRVTDVKALNTTKLTAIIVVVRRSAYKSDKSILQQDWDNAKELAAAYALAHQDGHSGCQCKPEIHCILLNGVSSNFDISALHQLGVNELRVVLDSFLDTGVGRLALIVLQNDGLSSNCLAIKQFFEPYRSLDIWLSLLDAIEDWQQGRAGNTFAHSLIRILVGVSINKELMRQANMANKILGLRPRNLRNVKWSNLRYGQLAEDSTAAIEVKSNLVWYDSVSFSRAVQGPGSREKLSSTDIAAAHLCALELSKRIDKRNPVDQKKLNPSSKSLDRHDIPYLVEDGPILCLQRPRCVEEFDDFDAFIRHLVEAIVRLEKNQRACPLCPRTFPGHVNRKELDDHLRRHFEPQLECQTCHDKFCAESALASHVKSSCPEGMPTRTLLKISEEVVASYAPEGSSGPSAMRDSRFDNRKARLPDRISIRANPKSRPEGATEIVEQSQFIEIDKAFKGQSTFRCSVCDLALSALQSHMLEDHPIIIRCGICKILIRQDQWETHQRYHLPAAIICDGCDLEIPPAAFEQHQRIFCSAAMAVHDLNAGAFICHVCAAGFKNTTDLRKHRIAHQESSMIMNIARDVGYPTHHISGIMRASINPVLIGVQKEGEDSTDILLATMTSVADRVDDLVEDGNGDASVHHASTIEISEQKTKHSLKPSYRHRHTLLDSDDEDTMDLPNEPHLASGTNEEAPPRLLGSTVDMSVAKKGKQPDYDLDASEWELALMATRYDTPMFVDSENEEEELVPATPAKRRRY